MNASFPTANVPTVDERASSPPHLKVVKVATPIPDPDESMIEVVVQIEYVDEDVAERPPVEDEDWRNLRRSCQERSQGLVLLTKPELSPKERFLQQRKGSA